MNGLAIGLTLLMLMAVWLVAAPLMRLQAVNGRGLITIAGAIPIIALVLYALIGSPQSVSRHVVPATQSGEMNSLIDGLAQRLAKNPDDLEGWMLLANSHLANQNLAKAQIAFEAAYRLSPNDIGLILSLIDVINTQHQFNDRTDALIAQALSLEPNNPLVLWFAAQSAKQKSDTQLSNQYLMKMQENMPKTQP